MKLILACHTDNEFSEGMDYAYWNLTPQEANLILRRKASFEALKQSDRDISELHFDDLGPVGVIGHYYCLRIETTEQRAARAKAALAAGMKPTFPVRWA